MNQLAALKLKTAAWDVAERFSSDREFNPHSEKFSVDQIIPLSDDTACVIYIKSSGKKTVALFYHLRSQDGHWRYFFPTDSHLEGLRNFLDLRIKVQLEDHNFRFNFQDVEVKVQHV